MNGIRRIAAALVLLLLSGAGAAVFAQGEHGRRFAVELAILAGDVRLLTVTTPSDLHRRGLRDRVASALGYLGLLAREAAQETGVADPGLDADIDALRAAFRGGRPQVLADGLAALQRRYPVDAPGFMPVEATPARLRTGRELYERLCIACHAVPDTNRSNPARDLFRDAREMPPEEFVARLLGGVRGVTQSGLENPLTDEELRGLLAWFRHGPSR
ncbi:c-type cytochrome [Thioalbus denitrificans]|uniref:Cbb3-type cytochrome c oxidase subunit III n=1 Tax=Thioalbus denitrificans TaxID=547122 RepID=A0A369CIZ4_9GAMM|nr:cytochrome c [Thioalbus denitrificans]RCX33531.1 cbb3-type cytochrome c oxidase subunit III [Thioalbus denitrificans]